MVRLGADFLPHNQAILGFDHQVLAGHAEMVAQNQPIVGNRGNYF